MCVSIEMFLYVSFIQSVLCQILYCKDIRRRGVREVFRP